LRADWQRHVLACSGYIELGMFDSAALVLEEIAHEDKNRNEVLGARVTLYTAAKKWDMATAVASHLVKVEAENEAWWISFAYSRYLFRTILHNPLPVYMSCWMQTEP
jgi:lipopolysaccharide biosynthesis regulator YciM